MANWDDWRLRGQEDYLKNQKFVDENKNVIDKVLTGAWTKGGKQ